MTDNVDAKAEVYVKSHIEPVGREPISTPSILLNTDSRYSNELISRGEVVTPYLKIRSLLEPIDPKSFIVNLRQKRFQELKARDNTVSNNELMKASANILGMAVRLSLRLEDVGQIYKLSNFEVFGNDNSFDISDLITHGVGVLWNPQGDKKNSAYDPDANAVVLMGDITSLEGVFIAIHEAKHAIDAIADPHGIERYQWFMRALQRPSVDELQGMSPETRKVWQTMNEQERPITASDVKLFLEYERNAHAFALRQMGRLISDRNILHALRDNVHNYSMQINTNTLAERGVV